MTGAQHSHGEDGHELRDVPAPGDKCRLGHDDHYHNHEQGQAHRPLELLGHLRHFNEEVGELDFLRRSAPRHIDFKHVAEKGLGDMKGHAAEEHNEHEAPGEVFDHCYAS